MPTNLHYPDRLKSILYTETTKGELSLSTTEHKGKGGGGGLGMLYPHTRTVKCGTRGTAQNPSYVGRIRPHAWGC